MVAQAFFYNAIFFTYALVLTTFYGIPNEHVGWYILPFAAGNVLGPLLLGRLFDTHRPPADDRVHLSACPALLLALTGWLFAQGMLGARDADHWPGCVIFFFASAAASSAYLTVERNLPAGDPRACNRGVLRGRHRQSAAWSARCCSVR